MARRKLTPEVMETTDKARDEWLASQKPKTRGPYETAWKRFVTFTGMLGDQIIASKKKDTEFAWEKKVLEFRDWLIAHEKLAKTTAKANTGAIRGFFAYHRIGLVFRRKETRRVNESARKTEDYKFTITDFQKMDALADIEEEYVVLGGKSFGFRGGDFLRLTRGDFEPYLDREPPISIGEFNTEKENVPAYPFIDTDAKPVIKLMLEKMTRDGRTKPTDRILEYKNEGELTRVLKRLAKKAGINNGSKRIRFHLLRKFLSDHLASYMSESKWKQIVGKTIGESAYISADELRKDYIRAMPETTFKNPQTQDLQKLAKKEALLAMTKAMGITETDLKGMFRRKVTTTEEEIEEIETILAEKQKLRDHRNVEAGGLAFQQQAQKALADLFLGAIEDAKKKLNQAS